MSRQQMQINPKDFVVALPNGQKKPALFRVHSVTDFTFSGLLEQTRFYKPEVQTLPLENIYVVLGAKPKPGKVYGCDMASLYLGKQTLDVWGKVCFFYPCPKEVVSNLKQAFEQSFSILQKLGLDQFIDSENCIWKIVGGKSRYAGKFEPSKDLEKKPHLFTIYPESSETNSIKDYVYCILHEFSHYLHFNLPVKTRLNAKWIKLFSTSIKRSNISKQKCAEFLDLLFSENVLPSDLKSSLDADDTLLYKWVLRWIHQQHGLTVKELNAIYAEDREYIRQVWPDISISYRDLEPIISEYACKSYKETFAEAFTFYLTNKNLPKRVGELVENTISYLKSNNK